VVEGAPNGLFWVSYEDALIRFGFDLIRLKPFYISIASNFAKSPGTADLHKIIWEKPVIGWYKMNVDAAYFDDGSLLHSEIL
jgi:hypothetical protein